MEAQAKKQKTNKIDVNSNYSPEFEDFVGRIFGWGKQHGQGGFPLVAVAAMRNRSLWGQVTQQGGCDTADTATTAQLHLPALMSHSAAWSLSWMNQVGHGAWDGAWDV